VHVTYPPNLLVWFSQTTNPDCLKEGEGCFVEVEDAFWYLVEQLKQKGTRNRLHGDIILSTTCSDINTNNLIVSSTLNSGDKRKQNADTDIDNLKNNENVDDDEEKKKKKKRKIDNQHESAESSVTTIEMQPDIHEQQLTYGTREGTFPN